MLELDGVDVHYAKHHVLKGVTLNVQDGEVVALVGAKQRRRQDDHVAFDHGPEGAHARAPSRCAASASTAWRRTSASPRGLVLVPEGRQVFPRFTVTENLLMGAYHRPDRNRLDADFDRLFAMFPRLGERRTQKAGSMSGGEQQMLAMARGLVAQPKCLLLDEPTLGLAPIVVDEIARLDYGELAAGGMTILLAEQNAAMALGVADRAYVLETGRVSLEGTGADLAGDEAVRRNYLGG